LALLPQSGCTVGKTGLADQDPTCGHLWQRALPDSDNVFNDLIRMFRKAAMPVEIVPQNSGLIEPRRRFDLRALGRLSAWGGAAAAALAVAAFASQTDTGSERLAKFVAGEPPAPAAVAI